jgi:hypothetical protein
VTLRLLPKTTASDLDDSDADAAGVYEQRGAIRAAWMF